MTVDEQKLEAFVERYAADAGVVFHAATVLLGDELGLYRAMGDSRWLTPAELAEATGTDGRYVTEWLAAQAAAGYAEQDPDTGRFRLPEEQALVLTEEHNPVVFIPGDLQVGGAMMKAVGRVAEAFRTGEGIPWGEQDPQLFVGTERSFRPNYIGNLVDAWIPALDGAEAKLRGGARVADVGCGHGASTILMAQAYPESTFVGYDSHPESVKSARKAATEAGVADRCTFEIASAKDYPGTGYDLVAFFDCLHDMGDPVGGMRHARQAIGEDGTVMLVEPFAGDDLAENLNPVGRIFYSASTMICVPNSRAQEVGSGLGAQAGEARMREVAAAAGFTRFRRAAETPFNLVLEARP